MSFFASWGSRDWLELGIVIGLLLGQWGNVRRGRRVGWVEGKVKQLLALQAGKITAHDEDDMKP